MTRRFTFHYPRFTNKGFTILEALIALFICAVGLFAVIGVLVTAIGGAVDSENSLTALLLAQRRIEEIRNLDYTTGIVTEARAAVSGFSGFERQVAVVESPTDLKRVDVTVYWKSKGVDVPVTLATYISKN